MKNKNNRLTLAIIVMLVSLSCGLPAAATPLPSNEFAPDALNTVVAQTVVAAEAGTLTAAPTPTRTPTATHTPTKTPTGTPTFVFLFPTYTLQPTITPTFTLGPTLAPYQMTLAANTTTAEAQLKSFITPEPWACKVQSKGVSLSVINPGDRFNVWWVVRNNGFKTWTGNTIDLVFDSGFRHEGGRIKDTSSTTPPGKEATYRVEIVAPKGAKAHGETYNVIWALMVGNTKFCHLKVSFTVK